MAENASERFVLVNCENWLEVWLMAEGNDVPIDFWDWSKVPSDVFYQLSLFERARLMLYSFTRWVLPHADHD